jgi:hypothetical protein
VDGVVLQKVGKRFRVRDVVDGHDCKRRVLVRRAEEIASDPPEPVDPDFDGHVASSRKDELVNRSNEKRKIIHFSRLLSNKGTFRANVDVAPAGNDLF